MPAWPATLPQFVLEDGYSETPLSQKIETQTDTGPAKQRRRFTKAFRRLSVTLLMTSGQRTAFDAFYNDDCQGGTLPFTWVDPVTRAATTFVFRDPPPQVTVRRGGRGLRLFVSLTLETR